MAYWMKCTQFCVKHCASFIAQETPAGVTHASVEAARVALAQVRSSVSISVSR